jgi:hypothetical protein
MLDMQYEDGVTLTLLWKKLNVVMADNGMPKCELHGFHGKNYSS